MKKTAVDLDAGERCESFEMTAVDDLRAAVGVRFKGRLRASDLDGSCVLRARMEADRFGVRCG